MVDNNCITITGVTISVGKNDPKPATNQTVDFDIRLVKGSTAAQNLWTLSINLQEVNGQPNTQKIHYTFSQSDTAQILTQFQNIWSNQP